MKFYLYLIILIVVLVVIGGSLIAYLVKGGGKATVETPDTSQTKVRTLETVLSKKTPIPQEITIPQNISSEIYVIGNTEPVNRYIKILKVEDKGSYYHISIDIKYLPEFITNLEDAFNQAEVWTDAVAKSSVDIFSKHGINKDISVWAQLQLGEGEVALLGNTWYYAQQNSYVFQRYKP